MRKGEERSRERAAVLIRLRGREDQSIGAVQIRLDCVLVNGDTQTQGFGLPYLNFNI